ncbi:amidase [Halegenticoccus tardaugens]|uniref:amidase n=1 Tax=Halegenticoccus tardaugens TaxID=2071624 RepID=UPI00100AB5BB|nr:amidase [Halegenticoccus tardaugens]
MTRMRSVDEADVEAYADVIDLEFAAGEVTAAAARVNTLADIYEQLESVPVESIEPRDTRSDVFETQPYRPGNDEDPHNAWLSKFGLERPESGDTVADLTVAIKDNTCVRGVELTCGSRAFEGYIPGEHAEVVDRLLDAGARIAGKTNMDELAFGPTSETSAFGPTENPVNTDHVAGGSSSGSASAVAAGDVDLALGTDTGGSVRIPSSYCGIVGIKPTFGRVPLQGIAELAFSMDHVGSLARDVETAARGLEVMSDPAPDGSELDYTTDLGIEAGDLTVGVCEAFFATHVSDAVERSVRAAIDDLEALGASIREVEIPALAHSRPAWWGIAPVEFAAAYATNNVDLWRRGRPEPTFSAASARVRQASSRGLGTNIKEMLALGTHLLETHDGYHYVRARRLRALLRDQFEAVFEDVDVLAAPSTPTTALKLDGFERGVTPPVNWDTHPTNLTGHPSISVPCGETEAGLPVGFQLMGAWHGERTVIDAAYTFEQEC